MSDKERRTRDFYGRVVRIEALGPGVNRLHWPSGRVTDLCVANEPDGPMNFMCSSPVRPLHDNSARA